MATLEQILINAGFEIHYTVSASDVKCMIYHPDWETDNPCIIRVFPNGEGKTQSSALVEAFSSDESILFMLPEGGPYLTE